MKTGLNKHRSVGRPAMLGLRADYWPEVGHRLSEEDIPALKAISARSASVSAGGAAPGPSSAWAAA